MATTIPTIEEIRELLEEQTKTIISLIQKHNNQNKESEKMLKSEDVKRILGISHGKLQQLRDRGMIEHTKMGKIIYYRPDAIEKMLKKQG